jgi:SAM-dependent methyltransferase
VSSPVSAAADAALPAGAEREAGADRPARSGAVLAVYAAAVFSSAFLLFLVQPMFGKMVLPLLGGSPAVWNTCMLFFQAALLGGYLYAHVGATRLSVRGQAGLHLALLAAAALALPIGVGAAAPEGTEAPIPWLLLLMATTVGVPFFVLAGTGPMLQRWFAASGHPGAANPYWLYAASNLGSMLALLGYPFLVEPRFRVAAQSAAWAGGYALLFLLITACAVAIRRSSALAVVPDAEAAAPAEDAEARVTARERVVWTALAFVPSSLLLGVTAYISTDLTPAPLLWVVPLALYLLSFTLVFAPRAVIPHFVMVAVQPSLLAVAAILLLHGFVSKPVLALPLHYAALFVTAMVCHGELARRRPPVRHLTEFYLWIAVGGVLGGAFNVLAAPVLFARVWEYPLVLALAALARPWPEKWKAVGPEAGAAMAAVGFAGVLLAVARPDFNGLPTALAVVGIAVVVNLIAIVLGRNPAWLALCLGLMLAVRTVEVARSEETLLAARSFFGHYRVYVAGVRDRYHVLTHGSTLHGAQSLDPARRRDPATYYLRNGPLGWIFNGTPILSGPRRVAVVGLGTGTAAAYGSEGDQWTFYEIDPGIERIARNPRYFSYLADSPAEVRVVLGDARLSMARGEGPGYHVILLDAFSSDGIPVHLLTREALDVYLRRLAPGGVLAFHVSNRYFDLEPVVAALARERGLAVRIGSGPTAGRRARYENYSSWMVVARREEDLGAMAADPRWLRPQAKAGVGPWTDDFTPLLKVFRW